MERIFIAIDLSQKIKASFAEIQERVNLGNAKIVKPKSMHLTLVFLGKVEKGKLKSLADELKKDLKSFRKFNIEAKGLGTFPNSKNPHILWVDLVNTNMLKSLEWVIKNRLKLSGFKVEDRPYVPHLSLARLKHGQDLTEIIKKYKDFSFGQIKVQNILIYSSQFKTDHHEHKRLYLIELGGKWTP